MQLCIRPSHTFIFGAEGVALIKARALSGLLRLARAEFTCVH